MKNFFVFFIFCIVFINVFADSFTQETQEKKETKETKPKEIKPSTIALVDEAITIKQAWERVLQHHDGIKSEEIGIQRAQKLSTATKLSFLPSIDLSAFYVHLAKPIELDLIQDKSLIPQIPTLPPINSFLQTLASPIPLSKQDIVMGALNIVYPLYTGGARIYASKIAALEIKDANEALRLKKLATFEELVRIYYGVVLHQEVLHVLENIQNGHYQHYQNAIKLQKAGQIARIEVLSAQVAYDRAKNKTAEAKNSLEIAYLAFQTILSSKDNLFPSSPLNLGDKTLHITDFGADFFVNETLQTYPALKTLENKTLSANEVKKLQMSKFLPKVGLFGSYVMKDKDSILNKMIPDWYVGIGASLPIITPEGRIQKYQAAKLAQLQLEALKSQARKELELLTRKTYKQVVSAIQEYESLDSSIELARENLKLQEEAFKQGVATSAQVVDARNALLAVLIEQKSVTYKAITSLADLMALSNHLDMFYDYQH
ncbi:TolC family protein [Helicobacter sp. 11S02596-1]|uniref:TolC family protein n=1 Tax=Helicobacter sp. 11S02596-1 TaxID=1476194 RepID=UPI000BA7898C|nr:TolC family protein [Helicobacter sp. 11S02596-1]PAF45101.1 lipase [Helicobacter sp. 11S02596-1]